MSTLDVRQRCAMAALLHHDANPPRPVASRIASPQPLYSRQSIPCSDSMAYSVFNACTLGTFRSVSAPNIRQVCQCPFPTLSPVGAASCIMKLSANWRLIFLFDHPRHHTVKNSSISSSKFIGGPTLMACQFFCVLFARLGRSARILVSDRRTSRSRLDDASRPIKLCLSFPQP